ncbi:MAG: FMN-binding negative transcriptional regulator [Ferruginibacter sp.]|nr:FMN-binding negative transcriptional regulator [Bacteroidota bacterium]MBX2919711.1 FMN-binding negative transcriptional regulator [Ferruginibacter sp.]
MYIPKHFEEQDKTKIISFMRQYSFAAIVNNNNGRLIATHLPFVVEERGDAIILASHFAKANDHWKCLEQYEPIVIFSEPHAYISPVHYDHQQNVPTWNYIAVHAYGKARLIEDEPGKIALIEKTVQCFEAAYQQQWNTVPEKFRTGMLNGIVGFEIEVTDLQAKYKLSQNRSSAEKKKIIDELSKSNDSATMAIGNYMREL